jgi:hypothetical protein
LEDLSSDGKIIIKWMIKKTGLEDMNWIDPARDREKGLALLNVINLRVQYNVGNLRS